jgi:protein-tyrosine phosphatase
MIDTHCHILPNLDDGPRDDDESVEMARIAAGDGIKKIIATPHIYDTGYSPEDIAARVDRLNRLLTQKNIPLQVYPGAEVSISMDLNALCRYAIHDTPYILIEFPHDHLPSHAGKLLQWLSSKGLKPIIAHPERNYSILRAPEILLDLLTRDVYIQITAGSITGSFGRDVQYCANFLLDSGKVDIIASDAHSKEVRPPLLSPAAKIAAAHLGEKIAQRLVCTNPAAVLTGDEIHPE